MMDQSETPISIKLLTFEPQAKAIKVAATTEMTLRVVCVDI